MAVDYHTAVAIKDLAARPKHRNGLDAVSLGALLVDLRVADLQVPKTSHQEEKDSHHHILEEGDLPRSEFRIVTQQTVRRESRFFSAIGMDGHKTRFWFLISGCWFLSPAQLCSTRNEKQEMRDMFKPQPSVYPKCGTEAGTLPH